MEMLLMGACLSLFGLAVTCAAFRAAMPDEKEAPAIPAAAAVAMPARFFAKPAPVPASAYTHVPIEALLLQIENHIRLEQAAAESFLAAPNPSLLHSRTVSPLVN
jgi:hypothetical protein